MSTEGAGAAAFIRGVPHPLPAGEHVLWEGAPDSGAMATHVFHRRLFLLYFAAMLVWWLASSTVTFGSSDFAVGLGLRLALAIGVLLVVEVLSRVSARTTWYAITNKRVVLKIGMVIEMSINIPFSIIESADVGSFKDGTGQLVLTLSKSNRIAYIALWPHCRVFALNYPQPTLRGLRHAHKIGALLANAVADAATGDQSTRVERTPTRQIRPESGAMAEPVGA